MDINSAPVARAVYLEAVKSPATTQILIMPEGLTSSHVTVPMTIYRRRISALAPRKTWKQIAATATTTSTAASPSVGSEAILHFAEPLFNGLAVNGWKLYKAPIVVEVTPEDLEEARMSKTPYRVLGRVWKSRKALGFPKEFIHPIPATPAPGI